MTVDETAKAALAIQERTSPQGVEVVPLADLAWAIAERDEARAQTGGRFCTVCGAPCWHLKGTDVDTCRRGHHHPAVTLPPR